MVKTIVNDFRLLNRKIAGETTPMSLEDHNPCKGHDMDTLLKDFRDHVSGDLAPCAELTAADDDRIRQLIKKELVESEIRELVQLITTYQPWKEAYLRISRELFDPATLDALPDDE